MGLSQIRRMWEIARRDGVFQLFIRLYTFGYNNMIRNRLPKSPPTVLNYNGVKVSPEEEKALDRVVPMAGDIPLYEQPIIRGVNRHVKSTDRVTVVGTGWGVVTTICAQLNSNTVISYEGSEKMYRRAKKTLELNDVLDQVDLRHAIVADNVDVWGDEGGAEIVPTAELPDCDVLILDCEGAEFQILEQLDFEPRVIIVETHGEVDGMVEHMGSKGFEIEDIELYNPEEDLYVLTCVRY